MNIQNINSFGSGQIKFKASGQENSPKEGEKAPTFLDVFTTSAKNSADLNDTVEVPRTIFKGYLSFMAGTTLGAIAPFAKGKKPLFATLSIAAGALALLGTYFFVRPYVIKGANQKPSETKTEIEVQLVDEEEKPVEKETSPKEVSEKPEIEKPQETPTNNNPEEKTLPSQIKQ